MNYMGNKKGLLCMAYFDKTKLVGFNAPLNPQDTMEQTQGCRSNNPSICSRSFMPNVCAFCRADGICKKPSVAWKKQYIKLGGKR